MIIYIVVVAVSLTLSAIWAIRKVIREEKKKYRHCSKGHMSYSILGTYCSKCGEKLPEYKRCPKGHSAVGSDIYCTDCGQK